MSNREELSRLSLEELEELNRLLTSILAILAKDLARGVDLFDLEGRVIAKQIEQIRITVTAAEMSRQ